LRRKRTWVQALPSLSTCSLSQRLGAQISNHGRACTQALLLYINYCCCNWVASQVESSRSSNNIGKFVSKTSGKFALTPKKKKKKKKGEEKKKKNKETKGD